MKIGIDLDNILNNLNQKWIAKYNSINGDNLTIEDIKSWDLHKYVKVGKEIYSYLDNPLFHNLEPLPDAYKVTKKLSKEHELFVVTATSPEHMEVKGEWLKKYFPHISQDNYITAYRKDLINVDLLIDDAQHNIIDFPKHTIVLDYAWNRGLGSKYKRAYSWNDIMQIIKDIN